MHAKNYKWFFSALLLILAAALVGGLISACVSHVHRQRIPAAAMACNALVKTSTTIDRDHADATTKTDYEYDWQSRLTKITSPSSTIVYSYGPRFGPSQVTVTTTTATGTSVTVYALDADGLPTHMDIGPDGHNDAEFKFDGDKHLALVTNPDNPDCVTSNTWTAGDPTSSHSTCPSDNTFTYTYTTSTLSCMDFGDFHINGVRGAHLWDRETDTSPPQQDIAYKFTLDASGRVTGVEQRGTSNKDITYEYY
jgi:hypothetical protein